MSSNLFRLSSEEKSFKKAVKMLKSITNGQFWSAELSSEQVKVDFCNKDDHNDNSDVR